MTKKQAEEYKLYHRHKELYSYWKNQVNRNIEKDKMSAMFYRGCCAAYRLLVREKKRKQ